MAAIARRAWIIRLLVLPSAMGSEQPPPPTSIHAGGSASSRGPGSRPCHAPSLLTFFRTGFSSRHARSRACATARYRYLEREQTESATFSEELKEHFLLGTPCLGVAAEVALCVRLLEGHVTAAAVAAKAAALFRDNGRDTIVLITRPSTTSSLRRLAAAAGRRMRRLLPSSAASPSAAGDEGDDDDDDDGAAAAGGGGARGEGGGDGGGAEDPAVELARVEVRGFVVALSRREDLASWPLRVTLASASDLSAR
jgi:hypothetical protein